MQHAAMMPQHRHLSSSSSTSLASVVVSSPVSSSTTPAPTTAAPSGGEDSTSPSLTFVQETGRHRRTKIRFTPAELQYLTHFYNNVSRKPTVQQLEQVASRLPRQIPVHNLRIYFQNKRAQEQRMMRQMSAETGSNGVVVDRKSVTLSRSVSPVSPNDTGDHDCCIPSSRSSPDMFHLAPAATATAAIVRSPTVPTSVVTPPAPPQQQSRRPLHQLQQSPPASESAKQKQEPQPSRPLPPPQRQQRPGESVAATPNTTTTTTTITAVAAKRTDARPVDLTDLDVLAGAAIYLSPKPSPAATTPTITRPPVPLPIPALALTKPALPAATITITSTAPVANSIAKTLLAASKPTSPKLTRRDSPFSLLNFPPIDVMPVVPIAHHVSLYDVINPSSLPPPPPPPRAAAVAAAVVVPALAVSQMPQIRERDSQSPPTKRQKTEANQVLHGGIAWMLDNDDDEEEAREENVSRGSFDGSSSAPSVNGTPYGRVRASWTPLSRAQAEYDQRLSRKRPHGQMER